MLKYTAIFSVLLCFTFLIVYLNKSKITPFFFRANLNLPSTPFPNSPASETSPEIIAQNLNIPWEIVFLPDQSLLVTQRSGELLHIDEKIELVQKIEGVKHLGEGGLLGLALHPDFTKNHWLYLYLTSTNNNQTVNRVERYTYENQALTNRTVILDNIPGSNNHDGGRLRFGPDRYLYITTGDAENPNSAQDPNSLSGKILRLKDDGSTPQDNPFGNAIYSYGHRNPQGLAWDSQDQLWAIEHGPSGTNTGYDELNRIVKGGNYGWPLVYGEDTAPNTILPVIQPGSQETWAPAGLAFLNDKLYFTGLRGEAIFEVTFQPVGKVTLKPYLYQEYGRFRAITVSPNGFLFLSTSNQDGRGQIRENDDKILKISL